MRTASHMIPDTTTSFPSGRCSTKSDFEHNTTPEHYTALRRDRGSAFRVSPETKFMGLALAAPGARSEVLRLLPRSREPQAGHPSRLHFVSLLCDTPLDEDLDSWQYTFFDQADRFLTHVDISMPFANGFRRRPRPILDELGVILPTDELEIRRHQGDRDHIPHRYWNAAGSLYAYLFMELSKQVST